MSFNTKSQFHGFTLVETLVGVALFLIIALASYQAYVSLFALISQNQYKILGLNLANEQFEIVRNLPYSDVGIQNGLPRGKVPHIQNLVRGGVSYVVTTTIRNVDQTFDGTLGGTPNDISPADNKLVEVEVTCPTCKSFSPILLTTTVAPKNLETASTNGALFVRVFDANGVAVPDAQVHIENNTISPRIVIDDVTDANGMLQIIDAPPGVSAYEITVTKPGYSTDRTYAVDASNPSPTKPHVTVVVQQVSQVSFAIDQLSTVTFNSVTPTCSIVPNMDFALVGAKTIGVSLPKYSQALATNASGVYSNSSMEWDAYTLTGMDAVYDIVGLNPLNPISLNPNGNHNVSVIVAPKNARSILVTVKDSATLLPVTGAQVTLSLNGSTIDTKTTDRGFINQTAWNGGVGQDDYVDVTKYFTDDGHVSVNTPSGQVVLKDIFGNYASDGSFESSTIDTGSASNFYNLIWTPADQPVDAGSDSFAVQFASNASSTASTTWTFKGPDGTSGSFYTTSNSSIASVHNGDRYVRYKAFFHTASTTVTPNLSDIAFTFTSQCTPPGQVIFTGLAAGVYRVTVQKAGYSTLEKDITISSSSWKEQEMIISP